MVRYLIITVFSVFLFSSVANAGSDGEIELTKSQPEEIKDCFGLCIVPTSCRHTMALRSRDSWLCTDSLTDSERVLPCSQPAPTRCSDGSSSPAGRTNWSCFNPSRPRMAPGPTSWRRAYPRRPRTALRPRRSSPPARMRMTGARRPALRASLQPRSPDSAPGSPPRLSSRRLESKSGSVVA